MLGGTRKSGFVPLCFWPGGEAASPDALHPGKAWEQSPGKSELFPWDFPGFLGPEALKPSVIPARQAELGCLSQQSYFAGCGSRDEARTAACGGCSVRAEISRNEQSRHEGELRRLRLRILRTLVGVWGEQPQRNPQVY